MASTEKAVTHWAACTLWRIVSACSSGLGDLILVPPSSEGLAKVVAASDLGAGKIALVPYGELVDKASTAAIKKKTMMPVNVHYTTVHSSLL